MLSRFPSAAACKQEKDDEGECKRMGQRAAPDHKRQRTHRHGTRGENRGPFQTRSRQPVPSAFRRPYRSSVITSGASPSTSGMTMPSELPMYVGSARM